MKSAAGFALAGILVFSALTGARAQDEIGFTVLSPEDVKLYGAIFQAEKSGQTGKAQALEHNLSDDTLMGYALEERYLSPMGGQVTPISRPGLRNIPIFRVRTKSTKWR